MNRSGEICRAVEPAARFAPEKYPVDNGDVGECAGKRLFGGCNPGPRHRIITQQHERWGTSGGGKCDRRCSVNVHYLYCSDGVDIIIDRTPRRSRRIGDMIEGAKDVARQVMARLPAYRRWDDWSVYIYDSAGQIEVVPFSNAFQECDVRTRIPRKPVGAIHSSDHDTRPAVPAPDSSHSPRSAREDRGNGSRRALVYH